MIIGLYSKSHWYYLDEYLLFAINPSSMSDYDLQDINTIYNSNISFESNPCLVFTKERKQGAFCD